MIPTMEETCMEWDAQEAERVKEMTFGHLAPEMNREYAGSIVWACSEYGDIVVIKSNFDEIPDSPWFYDDMNDYINKKSDKVDEGTVHKFVGTYRKLKNGRGVFKGKSVKIAI